jgi:hypothetical protein
MSKNKRNLLSLLVNNRFDELFNEMKKSSFYSNEVILIEGRYRKLKSDTLKGTVSEEFKKINFNQIREDIINLINNNLLEDDNGQQIFIDPRDNKMYKLVRIKNKLWFAENLKYFAQ